MTNKASLLLALVLALPATAAAQTAPPAPATVTPPAGAAPAPRHHVWSDADRAQMQADMAQMRTQMAKMKAAHAATRAKILAALTPAHKKFFAGMIASLAVSANPDYEAARAKLDATLSATEKAKILAVHDAAMKQMMDAMPRMKMRMPGMTKNVRFRRVVTTKDANGTVTSQTSTSGGDDDDAMPKMAMPPMPPMPGMAPMTGDRHVVMFRRDKMQLTAGEVLMHLAGENGFMSGDGPMMFRVRSFGPRDMHWKAPMPAPPVPAPTTQP